MTKASIPRWFSVQASLLAVLSGSGCYTYTPVLNTPPVGSDVRATVTDEEALRLSDLTGQLTRNLDGRLMGATDDSVFVSIVTFRVASEISGSRQLRQSIPIPRTGLEALEARQLSALRTGIAGMLAATGVALVVRQVVVGGGGGDNTDDGEPVGTLIPLIRIPIGR
ncbi:MAG: hypothetical protein OXE96_14340 [Gemmatimonadetes bacterium]|nr:hypothetical protein [Gemmatimonadota bacterium]